MMWLPRFLYIFQTIPIIPPKTFYKKVNSILLSFIWSKKRNRLKRKLLYYPREEGGLNLPDLENYHCAAQMFYIDQIINNANESSWINIENHQLMPKNYLTALFSNKKCTTANFIINSTLTSWSKIQKRIGQEIEIPRHIRIWDNPSIRIQNVRIRWGTWMNLGIQTIADITNQESVCSYTELEERFGLSHIEKFRYLQLKNWMQDNIDLKYGTSTELGEILKKERDKKRRLIGATYGILIKAESNEKLLENIYHKWNVDLDIKNAGIRWKECLQFTNKVTINENL